MKKYDSYKESDIKWLCQIPEHWETCRAKYMYQKENRPVNINDEVVTCFRDGMVTLRKNRRTTGFTESIKEIGYQGIRKGDLVIHVMDAFAGAIGVSDSDGKGTPVYSVCTALGDYNNYYYAFVLREMAKKGFIQSLYRGIRERSSDFRFDVFANQFLPVPPHEEQDQIVRFLDWKVSEINRLIAVKKREIELLKEQERSTIEHYVFHGIDECIEEDNEKTWMGCIPTHWNTTRIKFLFDMRDERNHKPLSEVNLISLYTNLGVIQNSDVEYRCGNKARTADNYKIVYEDDIIVNIILCWMGAMGRSPYCGVTSPAYDIYVPRKNVCSRYYHYLFRQPKFYGECKKVGHGIMAMRWRTYSSEFRSITVPEPPFNEQVRIANFLDEYTDKFEKKISPLKNEIQMLKELKSRLISDVVTGQIDVRNIEIPEFEYVEETLDAPEEAEPDDMDEEV